MFLKINWIKHGHESLVARTSVGKVLWYGAFSITKGHSLDDYLCGMPSVVCKFYDQEIVSNRVSDNSVLADVLEKLTKPTLEAER